MTPYYEHAGITIYHGDCHKILPLLVDAGIDMFFFSPPYNINNSEMDLGHGRNWKDSKWVGPLLTDGYAGHDDAMPWHEYEEQQRERLQLCWNCLAGNGAIFYNHKPRVRGTELWLPTSVNPGLPLRDIITWKRAGGVNFSVTHYLPTKEWVLILAKESWRLRDQAASGVGDVWEISQEADPEHPAPFPVALPLRAIETTTAQLVCDPNCGQGSTLRAAKLAGRRAIGIEIEEKYCEIAAKRLSQEVFEFGSVAKID